MNVANWLELLAILVSPLVAIQVSVYLANRKERRERQLAVFRTLMATRASKLAKEHVQALNTIDIEFYGTDKQAKAVLNAWKAYLDHLNQGGDGSVEIWHTRNADLFVELLHEMSVNLGYDFDKTTIRRMSYFPRGYGDADTDSWIIRKGLVSLMKGERALPITLAGQDQPPATKPEDMVFGPLKPGDMAKLGDG